jgi:soluble lytic murein transglycosylase-like protein
VASSPLRERDYTVGRNAFVNAENGALHCIDMNQAKTNYKPFLISDVLPFTRASITLSIVVVEDSAATPAPIPRAMTTQAMHCYRHVLRLARRVLRDLPCRALAGWGLMLAAALAPAPVGLAMTPADPVIQAADPSATAASADRAVDDDGADNLGMLAAALEDCPNALSARQRWNIARIINVESEERGYDPLFIIALVQVESGCSTTARGGDAVGLVQLLPSTARDVARRAGVPWRGERTLTEPSSSIQLGLRYLIELEEQFDGDAYRAVAAYNLGPARVAHMSTWRAQRTQYVRKILLRYEHLLDLYA